MTIFRPGDDAARKTVVCFSVEIAADSQSIRNGLSGREGMPDDRGMLFLLGDGKYSFWMTGMRYPLDIVIFGRDKRTVDIIRELQLCERCPLIEIPDGAAYVLEINAGLARKFGITEGDYFEIDDEIQAGACKQTSWQAGKLR